MMELLIGMVRNLVIIIIVATLLELILPPGKLKPLVQMTIGFFVIITILNPVLALLFHENKLGINSFSLPDEINREMNQALITGRDTNKQLQAGINEQLRTRMESQIRSLALLAPGVSDIEPVVKLDAQGDIKEVNLIVKKGKASAEGNEERIPAFMSRLTVKEDPVLAGKLKNWISSYYEVDPERININWR